MSQALSKFLQQLEHVDQLIEIHGRLQSGRGRRHQQDALHRAGVVLIIAAWQAYVEKVVEEALLRIDDDIRNPVNQSPIWAIHSFQLRRSVILNSVKKFNTPDDVRVRDLFQSSFGFNPWDHWEWRRGKRQWSITETRRRTNVWVLVRHSIAHGFDLPSDTVWLKGQNGLARLTLGLLKECRKHFVFLATNVDFAFAEHLAAQHRMNRPW